MLTGVSTKDFMFFAAMALGLIGAVVTIFHAVPKISLVADKREADDMRSIMTRRVTYETGPLIMCIAIAAWWAIYFSS